MFACCFKLFLYLLYKTVKPRQVVYGGVWLGNNTPALSSRMFIFYFILHPAASLVNDGRIWKND